MAILTTNSRISAAVVATTLMVATPFVARMEGFRNTAYPDSIGVPTICYGHTSGVRLGQVLSDAECQRLLNGDLAEAVRVVDDNVKAPLNVRQRAALASFVYNVGADNFVGHTLLRKLNAGDYEGAADEFLKWDHAGGRVIAGLTKRRRAERALFLSH